MLEGITILSETAMYALSTEAVLSFIGGSIGSMILGFCCLVALESNHNIISVFSLIGAIVCLIIFFRAFTLPTVYSHQQ